MFKLKTQNVLFWIAAPTLFTRYSYNQAVEERVQNLWRIHKNREERNLGGSVTSGHYDANLHNQDRTFAMKNGLQFSFSSIISGTKKNIALDNPFTRYHENIDEYGHFHDDADDIELYQQVNFDRHRPFMAKKEHVVGESPAIPLDDSDTTLKFYSLQGESLYTNPPDPNIPVIDHGCDEEFVWNHRHSLYNQEVI